MVKPLALCVTALLVAGCGGSGSSSAPAALPSPAATTAATVAPTLAPTVAPTAADPLNTATLGGSLGFVGANQHTVYVFDADLGASNTSACTGKCPTAWPPVTPPPGTTLSAPWASFVRTDGTTQLSYAGRALYMFINDISAGTTNGDGKTAFGNVWHVARPLGVATTPPTSVPTLAPTIAPTTAPTIAPTTAPTATPVSTLPPYTGY